MRNVLTIDMVRHMGAKNIARVWGTIGIKEGDELPHVLTIGGVDWYFTDEVWDECMYTMGQAYYEQHAIYQG